MPHIRITLPDGNIFEAQVPKGSDPERYAAYLATQTWTDICESLTPVGFTVPDREQQWRQSLVEIADEPYSETLQDVLPLLMVMPLAALLRTMLGINQHVTTMVIPAPAGQQQVAVSVMRGTEVICQHVAATQSLFEETTPPPEQQH